MGKLAIAVAHSLYPPTIIGGAEISTQILAETLNRAYTVKVLTVGNHNDKRIQHDVLNGVDVLKLPYSNLYWYGDTQLKKNAINKIRWRLNDIYNSNQYRYAKQLLEENKVQLLHTQNLPGLSLSLWKAARDLHIPIVHTLRDFSLIDPINMKLYSLFYQNVAKRFSHYVDAIIGISNDVLDTHLKQGYFKNAKSYVVNNVVESDELTCRLFENKATNENSKASLVLGYFGQISAIKGIDYLIQAVKELDNSIVSELRIFGEGPELQPLKELAKTDQRIVFYGKVDRSRILTEMSKVDASFVPSVWKEPFGRVIIESYLVGTPVFGSRIGGIPEVIFEPDFFCFEPGDVNGIKSSIQAYYQKNEKERQELTKAVNAYSKNFNTDMLLERHNEIYNQLLHVN
ncbi:glycosyl transferase group 1 [Paenibacillus curdlanolyticus YK9]|uniref:Glycosyl transferase group 1 n=1 Tax=Paenibacillus curdlanolyticus YK9 TaxID=717606 RepID=E0I7B2_9BACL|nr:glycosyltransferase family 4 protein [Paenibacillus curdlanolyticus]EFM11928.1 glycosyl transferase group 1 [Paenibacillus curdlanolyticus YK9]